MKITIRLTADGLDPNQTTTDPAESLVNYIRDLTEEILKAYPGAEVVHDEIDDTQCYVVDDDPDGTIRDEIQRISELVYETGMFWC